jgi:hypothetical protein
MVSGLGKRTGFEMEMRVRDGQALERLINIKRRDDPIDSFVLLLADTRNNRAVIDTNTGLFQDLTRLTFRELARILRSGQHPPNSLVFVPGPHARTKRSKPEDPCGSSGSWRRERPEGRGSSPPADRD